MTPGKTLSLVFMAVLIASAARALSVAADPGPAAASADVNRVFELRTYVTHPGKLDDLNKRFRDHTCKLFEKHGMKLVGFWTPRDEKDGRDDKLVYILSYPSHEAAKASWKGFQDDPEWKAAREASEKEGPIVKKVESVYLDPTDYSPAK